MSYRSLFGIAALAVAFVLLLAYMARPQKPTPEVERLLTYIDAQQTTAPQPDGSLPTKTVTGSGSSTEELKLPPGTYTVQADWRGATRRQHWPPWENLTSA